MAKSTNDSKSEGTNGEAKARRAPGRRSMDRKATDVHGLVASVADLARTKATTQAESHAVSARTATIELDALEKLSPEEVRRRAYELYVYRGGTQGGDLEDWYEAERQLRSQTH
jgi:Protein of unknown function (DUF2934)